MKFYILPTIMLLSGTQLQAEILKADEIKDAVAISNPAATYPRSAGAKGLEGWVRISYVIDTSGQVVEPLVESSSGHRLFEKQVLSTVKNWRFEPATFEGKPIQQCRNGAHFEFAMEGSSQEARSQFVKRYKSANALIKQGKIAEAQKKLSLICSSSDLI